MYPVRTHKTRPASGDPSHVAKQFPRFVPVPFPQPTSTTLPLSAILGDARVKAIQATGKIVFHAVGDTGGVNGTEVQEAIAEAMEKQLHLLFTANIGRSHPSSILLASREEGSPAISKRDDFYLPASFAVLLTTP